MSVLLVLQFWITCLWCAVLLVFLLPLGRRLRHKLGNLLGAGLMPTFVWVGVCALALMGEVPRIRQAGDNLSKANADSGGDGSHFARAELFKVQRNAYLTVFSLAVSTGSFLVLLKVKWWNRRNLALAAKFARAKTD